MFAYLLITASSRCFMAYMVGKYEKRRIIKLRKLSDTGSREINQNSGQKKRVKNFSEACS